MTSPVTHHKKKIKQEDMCEDNFILRVPVWGLLSNVISVLVLGVAAIFSALFINQETEGSIVFWVLPLALVGGALFYTYSAVYHASFKTQVKGKNISHREIFWPTFTFTFNDIKGAQLRHLPGHYSRLTLYSRTPFKGKETLLIADGAYIGYGLLLARLEKEGIPITYK